MIIALLEPKLLDAPGVGRVSVAELPAISPIVPPFKPRALVDL